MIVVFGSINVDLITPVPHLPQRGETVLGGDYIVAQGGKGANQALAAARGAVAGHRVAMVGTIGTDVWGDFALERLRGAGVDLSCIAKGRARTACGFISVDGHGQTLITVSPGANMETRAAQLDALSPAMTASDWLILQMEVPLDENSRALRTAKAAGARTLLNLAPAMRIDEATLQAIDVLVVNEVEAAVVAAQFGLPTTSHEALAKTMAARFNLTCAVTLGAAGSLAAEAAGHLWRVEALPVDVVDTTGAGDAFVGYLAAALDGGTALPDAMRFASAGASLSCAAAGAQTAYLTREAVQNHVHRLAPAVSL